ncbi:MAG: hypothetical protein ACXWUG_02065 [Polyangiales bacterium]
MKLVAFERRQAEAILRAFAPENATEGLVPVEGEVDYVGNLEKMANAMSDRARFGVRIALWIVAFAPIWTGLAFATMAGTPIEKRSALLDKMLASHAFLVRELALAMKIGASFALFSSKSIRERSRYDNRPAQAPRIEVRASVKAERPRALPVLRPSRPGVM